MSVNFPLKTDYVDDVLNTDANTNRKFRMINNGDGTVSFEDVTEYLVEGDGYGKNQINEQNEAINELNASLSEKTTYGTMAYSELNFALQSITYNYAVKHNATYCITIFSMSSSPHDVGINIMGINLGSQHLTYQYQRVNVQVALRKGTQITLSGAIGDGVNITYLQGVGD